MNENRDGFETVFPGTEKAGDMFECDLCENPAQVGNSGRYVYDDNGVYLTKVCESCYHNQVKMVNYYKRRVYVIFQTVKDEQGNYVPCIVTENEAGFNRTDWNWGDNYEGANIIASALNEKLGYSERDAFMIVLSSMAQGKVVRDGD